MGQVTCVTQDFCDFPLFATRGQWRPTALLLPSTDKTPPVAYCRLLSFIFIMYYVNAYILREHLIEEIYLSTVWNVLSLYFLLLYCP